jgi:hypothetical protein
VSNNEAARITTEITRRQWLLRLGEVGILTGVSGLVPEAVASLFAAEPQHAALPPGLYEPAADALVHALSSGHKTVAVPVGSETDYAPPMASSFEPQFFSSEDFQVVSRCVEIILGGVDASVVAETSQWVDLWFHSARGVRDAANHLDPLHRALAVAYYGEASVRELETADHPAVAREGIAALNKISIEKNGRKFPELSRAEQTELLHAQAKAAPDTAFRKFFEILRGEAIRGYYTSAAGLKELDYKGNAYYPQCPGCDAAENKPINHEGHEGSRRM